MHFLCAKRIHKMSIGDALVRFHNSFLNGYDEELFDELLHDEYEGYSNSTGTPVKKANLKSFMEASTGVVTHGTEILYENDEVLVAEWKCTFPKNSSRKEGSYTVLIWHKLKNGKIISHRSGMTRTDH